MTEYYYRSAGGCSRCDDMEGYYSTEPSRPHPNCMCEIEEVEPEYTAPSIDRDGHGWYFDYDGGDTIENRDGDDFYEHHTMSGHLYVTCCDGQTVFDEEFELEVILGPDDDTAEEQEAAFEEAEQKAENRARELMQNCPPCGDGEPIS